MLHRDMAAQVSLMPPSRASTQFEPTEAALRATSAMSDVTATTNLG